MKRRIFAVSVGLALLLFHSDPSRAVGLDREGTMEGEPGYHYFSCRNLKLGSGDSAGGKPNFKITVEGQCAVHWSNDLPGWSAAEWKPVTAIGRYYYETGVTEETVRRQGQTLVSSMQNCGNNPWVHGPSSSSCGGGNVTNNTGAEINSPHPLSAAYLPGDLRLALMNWEKAPTVEEMLKDWDPMPNTGGAPAMKIVDPGNFEVISPSTDLYYIALEKNGGFPEPTSIRMEFERLEETPEWKGDLHMPSDKSHWFQPLHSADWPYTPVFFPFPLPISSGMINGLETAYRVRVRAKSGSGFVGGWTSWRPFCVGSDQTCALTAQAVEDPELVQKVFSQKMAMSLFTGQAAVDMKAGKGKNAAVPVFGGKASLQETATPKAGKALNARGGKLQVGESATPKSGPAPSGIGAVPQAGLSRQAARKTRLARVNLSRLSVAGVSASPAKPGAGQKVELTIEFRNAGSAKGGKDGEYEIFCTKVVGTECPVEEGAFKVGKDIPAGQGDTVKRPGTRPARIGKYEVKAAMKGQTGQAVSVTVEVVPALKPERAQDAPGVQPRREAAEEERIRLRRVPRSVQP